MHKSKSLHFVQSVCVGVANFISRRSQGTTIGAITIDLIDCVYNNIIDVCGSQRLT